MCTVCFACLQYMYIMYVPVQCMCVHVYVSFCNSAHACVHVLAVYSVM